MGHVAQRILPEDSKIKIREMLEKYLERFPSIETAANSLSGVSASTIRNVRKNDFANISDEMWRNIRAQVGGTAKTDWVIVRTTALEDLLFVMQETKEEQGFTWAVSPPASGKSTAATRFQEENPNVFVIKCDKGMTKNDFADELAKAVGVRVNTVMNTRSKILRVCEYLRELDNPLLIFDQGDKLRDVMIDFFITIYNHIEDVVGVLFLSTDFAVKKFELGLRYNKDGYQEFWSRLGRKFYFIEANTLNDANAIAIENGISQPGDIKKVEKEAAEAYLDLRRVKKVVKVIRKRNQRKAA